MPRHLDELTDAGEMLLCDRSVQAVSRWWAADLSGDWMSGSGGAGEAETWWARGEEWWWDGAMSGTGRLAQLVAGGDNVGEATTV